MRNWIKSLDQLLRGQITRMDAMRGGRLAVPGIGFVILIGWLGMIYGACMGTFSLTPGGSGHAMQMLATTLKVPALFLLTLGVTFPSLYVFSALAGSPLLLPAAMRLLIAALAVMLAVLASIGPIVCFFSFTTISYQFMVLLNVLVFALAGVLGSAFLLQTLHRLTSILGPVELPPPVGESDEIGPLERFTGQILGKRGRTIFRVWVIVFGLVGAQMAWVLRPFIGHPGTPFTWFRHPDSNFFQALVGVIRGIFG